MTPPLGLAIITMRLVRSSSIQHIIHIDLIINLSRNTNIIITIKYRAR